MITNLFLLAAEAAHKASSRASEYVDLSETHPMRWYYWPIFILIAILGQIMINHCYRNKGR